MLSIAGIGTRTIVSFHNLKPYDMYSYNVNSIGTLAKG